MNNNLKKLEFDKILENISNYCKTYIGKKYAEELRPSQDKAEVQKTLAETSQGVILMQRNSTPPLGEIADITVYLKTLEGCGSLSIKALLELQNILQMSADLKEYLSKEISSQTRLKFLQLKHRLKAAKTTCSRQFLKVHFCLIQHRFLLSYFCPFYFIGKYKDNVSKNRAQTENKIK